jgi:hypothetical protein
VTALPEEAGSGVFTAGALPLDTPGITLLPDPLADDPVFALLPELELSVAPLAPLLPELGAAPLESMPRFFISSPSASLLVEPLPVLPVAPVSLPVAGVAGVAEVAGVVALSFWPAAPDEVVPVVPCEVPDVSCANADPMTAARQSVIVLRRKLGFIVISLFSLNEPAITQAMCHLHAVISCRRQRFENSATSLENFVFFGRDGDPPDKKERVPQGRALFRCRQL